MNRDAIKMRVGLCPEPMPCPGAESHASPSGHQGRNAGRETNLSNLRLGEGDPSKGRLLGFPRDGEQISSPFARSGFSGISFTHTHAQPGRARWMT